MDPKEISSAVTIALIWLLILMCAIVIAVGCSAIYQQNIIQLNNKTGHAEQIYQPKYFDEKRDKNLPSKTPSSTK